MATIAMQRAAFREVAKSSHKGLAEVMIMCPKCYKVVRIATREVNGFNEYAYKYVHYDYEVSDRKKFKYYGTDFDGTGCCF